MLRIDYFFSRVIHHYNNLLINVNTKFNYFNI